MDQQDDARTEERTCEGEMVRGEEEEWWARRARELVVLVGNKMLGDVSNIGLFVGGAAQANEGLDEEFARLHKCFFLARLFESKQKCMRQTLFGHDGTNKVSSALSKSGRLPERVEQL